jgi:transposase
MERIVSSQRGKYSSEFKDAAVREVIDNSRTIADVARSLGAWPPSTNSAPARAATHRGAR